MNTRLCLYHLFKLINMSLLHSWDCIDWIRYIRFEKIECNEIECEKDKCKKKLIRKIEFDGFDALYGNTWLFFDEMKVLIHTKLSDDIDMVFEMIVFVQEITITYFNCSLWVWYWDCWYEFLHNCILFDTTQVVFEQLVECIDRQDCDHNEEHVRNLFIDDLDMIFYYDVIVDWSRRMNLCFFFRTFSAHFFNFFTFHNYSLHHLIKFNFSLINDWRIVWRLTRECDSFIRFKWNKICKLTKRKCKPKTKMIDNIRNFAAQCVYVSWYV